MSFPPPNQLPFGAPGMPQGPGNHQQASYGGHHQQQHHRAASEIGASAIVNTTGAFEGVQFKIDHRDTNSLLNLQLQPGFEIKARPGSMVAMAGTVQIKGKMKFSFKKLVTGGEMSESNFTGPGEVLLAPDIWGDIVPIHIDGNTTWSVGKDAYLASTMGVVRSTKSQGVGKGLFSGEGFFVSQVTGQGIFFAQSIGAIIKRTLADGEQWVVDNGHLVAWTATYKVERIAAGGFLSGSHTGEGLVCRFTGPGLVYIQTRNPDNLGAWMLDLVQSAGAA